VTQYGEVFDRMWQLLQHLGRDVHAAAGEVDLTPMQAMLLDRLEDGVPSPMSDLARQLHCDKSNLTGLVDGLERRGLVQRTTPPNDRRVRALVTTEQGRAVRQRLSTRLREQNPLLRKLSTQQARAMLRLLDRLLDEPSPDTDR
jgi:DNA-binding MarR family transcriptional regulator